MSVQLERQVRRMPSTKGYRSYHGRGGAGRIVLIVLLCLILLAAVGFLVLQRYAVYGSDGSIRFDLPWKQTEEPSDPSAPDGASRTPDAPDDSPDVIIDEPEPPAKPELTELHGAELSESVLRGNADAALAAVPEGANAVALRMKNARGELLYDSALQEAIDVNAVKGGSGANAVIAALTGSEVYTIARINATHDSLYSFAHMADAGVLQLNYAGYIWYDPDSTFYLAPEKSAARQYIVSVARECAELGFDELLFDEFGYPTRGRLNNIDESARTLSKSAALAQLAEELRSGTEAYGVRLSVQLDAEQIGVADVGGLDGADAQLLAGGLREQNAVGPQNGRAGKGLVGDAQPLAAALGQARVARDKKLRERILLQQAEHLPVKMVLMAVAGKDQQRLLGIERRQRAGVVRLINVVEQRIKLVPLNEKRAVGDECDLHGKDSFARVPPL